MITIGKEYSIREMLQIPTPNVKRLLKPDPGYVVCDVDLEQADARVVGWTSSCKKLKAVFNDPKADLHTENAKLIFGACDGKKDPRRQKAKAGCHATNYGATPPTLAKALNCTIREAEIFQAAWFAANPEILAWHNRVRHNLNTTRMVYNAFGYRRFFLGRINTQSFNEALAWEPQSTVGITINKVWDRAVTNYRGLLRVSMQVHDSLVFQFHNSDFEPALAAIKESFIVPIQYPDDTLIISTGKPEVSMRSWGDVHAVPWDTTRDEFLALERMSPKDREDYWKKKNAKAL